MADANPRRNASFSVRTGLWTLAIYTAVLGLLGVLRGSSSSPDFAQRVVLVALSGFLVGYFLDPLARAIQGSAWKRFGVLALLIFSLATVSNALETILYLPAVAVAGTVASGLLQAAVLGAVLMFVAKPLTNEAAPRDGVADGRQRLAFLGGLSVLWVPIYFLFVSLDTPVVRWLQRDSGDVFAHPSVTLMIGVELVRGLVHAAVMLGIASLAQRRPRLTWLWGALTIAILNGWLPILPASTLPLGVRIANGTEITLSAITFAGLAAYWFPHLVHASMRLGSQGNRQ